MNSERYSMDYEFVLKRFLGDRGYGQAGAFYNDVHVKSSFLKLIPIIRKRIDQLDTTNRHKELMFSVLERLRNDFKIKDNFSYKKSTVDLFLLNASLLGYERLDGKGDPVHNVFYWQSRGNYLWNSEDYRKGKNIHDIIQGNERNVILLRKEVFSFLKDKKVDDNIIAQVLNTSEYQIKKLKNNL